MSHYHDRIETISQEQVAKTIISKPADTPAQCTSPTPISFSIIQCAQLQRLKQKANKIFLVEFQRLEGIECFENTPRVLRSKRALKRNLQVNSLIKTSPIAAQFYSSTSSDDEDASRMNAKGKPVVNFPQCNKLCEKKTGLRIHLLQLSKTLNKQFSFKK